MTWPPAIVHEYARAIRRSARIRALESGKASCVPFGGTGRSPDCMSSVPCGARYYFIALQFFQWLCVTAGLGDKVHTAGKEIAVRYMNRGTGNRDRRNCQSSGVSRSTPDPAGDAEAGRRALSQYLCATCHRIPGVTGANKHVGPPLDGIGSRKYLAGVLTNTPENMIRWLQGPQQVDPLSAMPDLGVREQDARDMAAYLSTLREPD